VTGIIDGLVFLHGRDLAISHGDIRAGNILVSDEGILRLAGFGQSKILDDSDVVEDVNVLGGSLRWMSPEILTVTGARRDEKSDVWAFGTTVLEILSGRRPYASTSNDVAVIIPITKGIIPSREDAPDMTDGIWSICQLCWKMDPKARAAMRDIPKCLFES
ncbi:kinase-like domain-containing protein, partial [Hysterangium stoloniferum]